MELIIGMLALFVILLLFGVPVAFCLGIPIVLFMFLNPGITIDFIPQRVTATLFTYVLIALPAFLLSARMMNITGVTDRLLNFSIALVGRFKGGLAYANALASMLFASMSGTAVGDAGGLGQIEIKMMKDAGYDVDFATGITAASSVLGPIIPPSVVMVLLGATIQISIGKLFIAGIIPGLLLVVALMINIWVLVNIKGRNKTWPTYKVTIKEGIKYIINGILPLFTPVIIIGGIIFGIFTPTEAAVVAIAYATVLGVIYRELDLKKVWETLEDTVVMTGIFMFIAGIAGFFTWVLTREGLPRMIAAFIGGIVGDNSLFGLLIIGFILILIGLFIDTSAAVLVFSPAFLPVVQLLEIDLIHFGIVMTVALLIGIITPPYGICLFVMSNVANISVGRVTRQAIQYLPAMVVILLLLIFIPALSLWLPNLVFN